MVATATHAPLTILMIFEMTGDFRVIIGLMTSCIIAMVFTQRLRRKSIYTVKLLRRRGATSTPVAASTSCTD